MTKKTVAPFDHSLGGPEVISLAEAERRCKFLRTDVGRQRTFKVTRGSGIYIVKANSAADAAWFTAEAHRQEMNR